MLSMPNMSPPQRKLLIGSVCCAVGLVASFLFVTVSFAGSGDDKPGTVTIGIVGGWPEYNNKCGATNMPECGGKCPPGQLCQPDDPNKPGSDSNPCKCGLADYFPCHKGGYPFCGGSCNEVDENNLPYMCVLGFDNAGGGQVKPVCACVPRSSKACGPHNNGLCVGSCPDSTTCGEKGTNPDGSLICGCK